MGRKSAQTRVLGPLPVDRINATLGLELDPGEVVISRAAQAHAARRHPSEFADCFPHLGTIVLNPLLIGDDGRNPGRIELIGRVPSLAGALLVAIDLRRDAKGRYHICSFYPVSDKKVENRKLKGHLRVAVNEKSSA